MTAILHVKVHVLVDVLEAVRDVRVVLVDVQIVWVVQVHVVEAVRDVRVVEIHVAVVPVVPVPVGETVSQQAVGHVIT